jgi:hypothetical protein
MQTAISQRDYENLTWFFARILGGFFKSRWQEKGFSILVGSKDNFKE